MSEPHGIPVKPFVAINSSNINDIHDSLPYGDLEAMQGHARMLLDQVLQYRQYVDPEHPFQPEVEEDPRSSKLKYLSNVQLPDRAPTWHDITRKEMERRKAVGEDYIPSTRAQREYVVSLLYWLDPRFVADGEPVEQNLTGIANKLLAGRIVSADTIRWRRGRRTANPETTPTPRKESVVTISDAPAVAGDADQSPEQLAQRAEQLAADADKAACDAVRDAEEARARVEQLRAEAAAAEAAATAAREAEEAREAAEEQRRADEARVAEETVEAERVASEQRAADAEAEQARIADEQSAGPLVLSSSMADEVVGVADFLRTSLLTGRADYSLVGNITPDEAEQLGSALSQLITKYNSMSPVSQPQAEESTAGNGTPPTTTTPASDEAQPPPAAEPAEEESERRGVGGIFSSWGSGGTKLAEATALAQSRKDSGADNSEVVKALEDAGYSYPVRKKALTAVFSEGEGA